MNKKLSREKKVIIYRNTDSKKVIVDSIKEAIEATGCTQNYIRLSATKPNHYSNKSDDWQPTTTKGELRKQTIKPLYRFEFIEPILVVARPMFESEIKEFSFKSYYKAIKTIGCSEATFYTHKKKNMKYIVDKQKRLWTLEWRNQDERTN
jgi:hypothetical protein